VGEATDIVNAGVTLIHLVANHAGVETVTGGYASGFPVGFTGAGLAGGQQQRVTMHWKQSSDWYEVYKVDFDYTVGMNWLWGASIHGAGQYIDQITVTLDVGYLPADFTVDVTAHFPTHGNNLGTDDAAVAGMPFTIQLQKKGFFGQVVNNIRTLNCEVKGDGNWQMA
jgi:hypothetical protein